MKEKVNKPFSAIYSFYWFIPEIFCKFADTMNWTA